VESLDEADTLIAHKSVDILEHAKQLFQVHSIQDLLQLNMVQRFLWRLGIYPGIDKLSKQLFRELDMTHSHMLNIAVLDFLAVQLQGDLTVSATTYKFLEVCSTPARVDAPAAALQCTFAQRCLEVMSATSVQPSSMCQCMRVCSCVLLAPVPSCVLRSYQR
jgi:hypothetical protein